MKRWTPHATALAFATLCLATQDVLAQSPTSCPSRPFTVEASIGLTHVLDDSGQIASGPNASVAVFSPDRERFVIHTRRGDLADDVNVETLLMWSVGDWRHPTVVFQHRFHSDDDQVSRIIWLNNHEIALVSPDDHGIKQGFRLDVDTHVSTQLTFSTQDVGNFAVAGSRVLYYARQPIPDRTNLNVTDQNFFDLTYARTRGSLEPVALFQHDLSSGQTRRIASATVTLFDTPIWLSPSGRWAVTFTTEPSPPAQWGRYRTSAPPLDYLNISEGARIRYQLVDLDRNTAHPLLDAPIAMLVYNGTPRKAFWSSDERSVIVTHTQMPLSNGPLHRDLLLPAIAEVRISDGRVTRVADEGFAVRGQTLATRILDAGYEPSTGLLTLRVRASGETTLQAYGRNSHGWQRMSTTPWREDSAPTLQIVSSENFAERARVFARSAGSEGTLIYDPMSELDCYSLGRPEQLTWTDANEVQWQGQLIYPVQYVPGQRYPLVVQTHAGTNNEFLIDGPYGTTTAFAAQALANVGFVVLQIQDNPNVGIDTPTELASVSEGWKAGVTTLVDRGLVDANHVGVIGWSRTGYQVVGALALQPTLFAAASISDSVLFNYSQSLFDPGNPSAALEFQRMTGGLPGAVGYAAWFEANPFYRLRRTHAAVRIESIGELSSMWEAYATLRQANVPVAHYYYPHGSHNLIKPSERLASQQGTVDWFRFWLQGYVDPNPEKRGQYAQWQSIRQRTMLH